MDKRVNFNMSGECHALLKGVCALKGITLSEYLNSIIKEDFCKIVREDKQVQSMFLAGTYKNGGPAYLVKESLIEELDSTNDLPA